MMNYHSDDNFLSEFDEPEKVDYDNIWASDFQEIIEKGFETKLKKNTIAYKEHKKELNRIIKIYNNRFGKTYNFLI